MSTVGPKYARILLVDSHGLGMSARKSVLEDLGHTVATCTEIEKALEYYRSSRFDVVIVEYKPPGADGLNFIRDLKQQDPDARTIVISGFVDAMGLTESTTGADAVIQKSANEINQLVSAVRRILSRGKHRKIASKGPPRRPRT